METKRIWGTEERPYTSYSCGSMHTYYEQMGKIKIKYEEPNIKSVDEKKD